MNKRFLIFLITFIFAFLGAVFIIIKFFEKIKFKDNEFYEDNANNNSKKEKEKEKYIDYDEDYWGKYFIEEWSKIGISWQFKYLKVY